MAPMDGNRSILLQLAERVDANSGPGKEKDKPYKKSGEDLEAAMSIRMILISRTRCHQHAQEHDEGRQHIACELDTGGGDRRRMTQNTRSSVQNGEDCTARNTDNSPPPTSIGSLLCLIHEHPTRMLRCVFSVIIAAAVTVLAADKNAYVSSIEEWRQQRETKLKAEDGWLSLAGLFWLQEGDNAVGSKPGSRVQLPKASPRGGRFCTARQHCHV